MRKEVVILDKAIMLVIQLMLDNRPFNHGMELRVPFQGICLFDAQISVVWGVIAANYNIDSDCNQTKD